MISKLTLGMLCLNLALAGTAAAVAADVHTALLEGDGSCSEWSDGYGWYYSDETSYSYYSNWYSSTQCADQATLAGARVTTDDGTLASAEAGRESSNWTSSSSQSSASGYGGHCETDPEWNFTWCTYDSYSWDSRSSESSGAHSREGVRVWTAPTGGLDTTTTECSSYSGRQQESRGYSWRNENESGSYSEARSYDGSYSDCFTGLRGGQSVSGTGTAADGTQVSTFTGYRETESRYCSSENYGEEQCHESAEDTAVASLSLTIPGVGTFSSGQSFSPENPHLLG